MYSLADVEIVPCLTKHWSTPTRAQVLPLEHQQHLPLFFPSYEQLFKYFFNVNLLVHHAYNLVP